MSAQTRDVAIRSVYVTLAEYMMCQCGAGLHERQEDTMKDYVICMDASGDILRTIVEENDIAFVPMEYSLGDEMRTSRGCE